MATAIYNSLVDHSPLDGTGDEINGSEVDVNPQTLAQILDGTTATDLGQDGVVDFRFTASVLGLRAIDLDAAAAAVHYGAAVEWDPVTGNMTDGSSGVGIQFIMPDDANTQTIYGRMYVLMRDDAAASDDADFVFEAAVAGTLTTEIVRFGGGGAFVYNEDSADLDMRFESNNLSTLFSFDAGLDSIGIGAVATDGSIFEITPGAVTRTAVTSVANGLNIPADTDNFDNGSSTLAIYAAAALGVQTLTGDTATLTFTDAATLYIAGIPAASTNVAITNTARALWVDTGTSAFGGDILPDSNDAAALGSTTLGWSDLHLATGGVINWANGEVTITETDGNTLTIEGTSTLVDIAAGIFELNNAVRFDTGVAMVAAAYAVGRDADGTNQLHFNVPTGATFEFSVNDVAEATLSATNLALGTNTLTAAALLANANDSGAIGASGTAFSDLFLASGAVINFAAGNMTITHSAAALAFAGGRVTFTGLFDSPILLGTGRLWYDETNNAFRVNHGADPANETDGTILLES